MVAYLEGEPAAGRVRELLKAVEGSQPIVYFSVINLGEVFYVLKRERNLAAARQALAIIDQLPIAIMTAGRERVLSAALVKANYPLSYADAFVVAAAQEFQATVITGDPEFARVAHLVQIEWLSKK